MSILFYKLMLQCNIAYAILHSKEVGMNERIKLLRKALELNQTDFGARIGVKQGTVAAYESGARVPLDSVVVSICREFGVSESWLRSGEGEMFLQLSREEEITKFCMSIIRDPDSEFQRQFVSVLARLEPPQWQLLSDMADKLLAQRDAQKKDAE